MAASTGVEEDATELAFPKEFDDPETKTLLISEVKILLEHRKTQNESQEDEQVQETDNMTTKEKVHTLY